MKTVSYELNEIAITVTNDKKEKDQSFEATADFNYTWKNPCDGYGGDFSLTAFGKTELEARTKLRAELHNLKLSIINALLRDNT